MAYTVFKYASMGYILYLAYRIMQSSITKSESVQPLGFGQGIVLNLINPKAYIVGIAVLAQFATPGPAYFQSVMQIMTIIMIIAIVLDQSHLYRSYVITYHTCGTCGLSISKA